MSLNVSAGAVPHITEVTGVGVGVAAVVLAVLGVIGNLLTILALLKDRRLRVQATTAFVISLAVSDFLFCSINLPLTAVRYLTRAWVLGNILCKLFPFFFYGNVAASLMSMMAITINRYVLIRHPHLYRNIYTSRNIILMVAVFWLFSFGMLLPPLFSIWGTTGLEEMTFSCTIKRNNGKSPKKFLFIVGFLLPIVAIVFCYSSIFMKVRASEKRMSNHALHTVYSTPSIHPKQDPKLKEVSKFRRRQRYMKLIWTMGTIFIIFISCYLPLMVVNVLEEKIPSTSPVTWISSMLAWSSAVVNPLVYFLMHTDYRAAFLSLFGVPRNLTNYSVDKQSRKLRLSGMSTESLHPKPKLCTLQAELQCLQAVAVGSQKSSCCRDKQQQARAGFNNRSEEEIKHPHTTSSFTIIALSDQRNSLQRTESFTYPLNENFFKIT